MNSCRINFRSSGRFTVNNIAKYFNGGGHAFASGAVIKKPLDEAKRTVIEKTKKMILDQIRVEN